MANPPSTRLTKVETPSAGPEPASAGVASLGCYNNNYWNYNYNYNYW